MATTSTHGARTILLLLTAGLVVLAGSAAQSLGDRASSEHGSISDPSAEASDTYGRVPAFFEPNLGQADPAARFLSRGPSYSVALTDQEVVLSTTRAGSPVGERAPMRMRFVGSLPDPRIVGTGRLPGVVNQLSGSDPRGWLTRIPTYAGVRYEGIYPGIDLVFHGGGGRPEYDFVVAPGVDPRAIALAFPGADALGIDASGDLTFRLGDRTIRHLAPVVFQSVAGARQQVAGGFVRTGTGRIGFEVGAYDATRPLIIDPVITSTFLGGESTDSGLSIAADASGNAYVTGFTASTGFPTSPGAAQGVKAAGVDVFVTKLNPAGTGLVYSTFIGGGGTDWGSGIVLDASGNAYVTGRTDSTDFPTTAGAFDRTFGGGVDAFALKLNPTGTALTYSTYLGGSGFEHDRDNIFVVRSAAIAVDAAGNAYLTGQTTSADFPTANAIDPTIGGGSCPAGNLVCSDVYLTKLNPTGSGLVYSTFLGGPDEDTGKAIFVDASGNAYLAGTAFPGFPITPGAFRPASQGFEGFVSKVNAAGSALVYSTFLGGELSDAALGVAADASGNAFVTGSTTSFQFPTTPGAFQRQKIGNESDAFVTKLNPTGGGLVYSTFLGERETDEGVGIAIDGSGNASIAGTSELGFPVLPCPTATLDVFTATFNAAGSALRSSTCLGGRRDDTAGGIALDPTGNAYVTGETASSGAFSTTPFPTTPGVFQPAFAGGATDAFVFKASTGGGGGGENPTISISDASVTEGNKGSTTASFTATLSASSTNTVTVAFATANGTAVAGSDYTSASSTLSFAPGETSRTVTVSVIGDRVDEQDETFTVNLSAPVNGTIQDGTGVGTIVDDDGSGGGTTPTISISDASVTEGNKGSLMAAFTVTLSTSSTNTVTVAFATANGTAVAGSDYVSTSGTLTFSLGQTSRTISVAVIGNLVAEPTETFTVSLSGPVNATIVDGAGVGTIVDND
jgi:hypothetical protein